MHTLPRAVRPACGQRARGFTQLELVMTMVLAGLLSAGAVHQLMPQAGKSSAAFQALRLADDLRHTRLLAMGWGKTLVFSADSRSWRVSCLDSTACTLALPPASGCPDPTPVIADPGHHGPFCVMLENGVVLSGPARIEFDLLGRPQSATALLYQLIVNGAPVATVSLAAETSFVITTVLQ